jgi:hypothetical protein
MAQVSKVQMEVTGKDGGAIEVNHNTIMDTARRVLMILEDASDNKTIDVAPLPELTDETE